MSTIKRRYAPNGITIGMVLVIILSISIVLILTTIKIYMGNRIYYLSREINTIEQGVLTLRAEKALLEQKVEALKYKNRVTDTIFVLDESE